MADDVEAQEIHATITSVGTREEPLDDDQMEPSDVVGDPEDEDEDEDDLTGDDVTDSDAVIVDDVTPVRAGDVSGQDEDEDEDADGDEDDEPDEVSAYGHPADEDADDDAHPETMPAEAILADPAPSETTVPDPVDSDPVTPDLVAADDAAADDAAADDAAADDVAADDALVGDREPAAAYAMPVAPADPASAEALPKHARPSAAVPEADRPGMPSDVGEPADGDLFGDPDQWHERWAAIQSTFVDDPRGSVEAAADLVGETINALVTAAKERETGLRGEWDHDGVDTEELRNTLRNYRGLLDRLIAV
jgi:hypothetical protein